MGYSQHCGWPVYDFIRRLVAEQTGTGLVDEQPNSVFAHDLDAEVRLLDQVAEAGRHLVGAGQEELVGLVPLDLPPQPVLASLQVLADERLEPRDLLGVGVDALIVELAQRLDDAVEILDAEALLCE